MNTGERVGVIGCGNIGAAIAANLVQAGHRVSVHDAVADRLKPLVGLGARAADSARKIAERSEVTFLSLPTPAVVDEVAREWLAGGARGAGLGDLGQHNRGHP